MNKNSNNTSASGVGFFGLLTIAFIVLKLTGFISWSWWLVLMPLYLPILIVIAIVVIIELRVNKIKKL